MSEVAFKKSYTTQTAEFHVGRGGDHNRVLSCLICKKPIGFGKPYLTVRAKRGYKYTGTGQSDAVFHEECYLEEQYEIKFQKSKRI